MQEKSIKKYDYISVARGIGIIFVVFIQINTKSKLVFFDENSKLISLKELVSGLTKSNCEL